MENSHSLHISVLPYRGADLVILSEVLVPEHISGGLVGPAVPVPTVGYHATPGANGRAWLAGDLGTHSSVPTLPALRVEHC